MWTFATDSAFISDKLDKVTVLCHGSEIYVCAGHLVRFMMLAKSGGWIWKLTSINIQVLVIEVTRREMVDTSRQWRTSWTPYQKAAHSQHELNVMPTTVDTFLFEFWLKKRRLTDKYIHIHILYSHCCYPIHIWR